MKIFCLFTVLVLSACLHAASPLQPSVLTCEYLQNPLGIDIAAPRLGWNFTSSQRNQFQSAYEIIVSDSKERIDKSAGTAWTSGKISSAENIQLAYAGSPLQSFTRYYWRVKVYNQNGEASEWSAVNWFETGLLSASDWKAKWINDGKKNPARDEDYYKEDRMPLLRKSFRAAKK